MLRLPTENTLDREENIMAEWITTTLEECTDILGDGLHGTPKYTENGEYAFVNGNNLVDGEILIKKETKRVDYSQYDKYKKPLTNRTILVSINGTLGNVGVYGSEKIILGKSACYFNVKESVDKDFIYYIVSSPTFKQYLESNATGTTIKNISLKQMREYTFELPEIGEQKRISSVLRKIDEKIKNNRAINNNLEEQLSALFVNMFGHSIDSLDNSDIKLGDLIESVDNRGKTPPLSDEPTDYPIIDVRALSSNSRIIDYTNCTKYVSKETYNNWFRSGHPKEYDILISTVGSLAEMKIFLGTTGCIAQNVVGFRTKDISPLYLYQYLNYIKNDLVAYNIGSVQPSIKVTHIIKHSIYVASKEDIEIFDSIARNITKKIFANCQENEALKQMRDTLLPKLMSGEFDVSNIKI